MFEDDDAEETPTSRGTDPTTRAKDKADAFRMHAELAAVFEGVRKFDAQVRPLGQDVARDVQRRVAKLEKSKGAETPLLTDPAAVEDAGKLLQLDLAPNDYHVSRRPGETMILRVVAGEGDADAFYERLQAHFDAALAQLREEEKNALGWKQDPQTTAYLEALEKIEVKMAERYIRPVLKKHPGVVALSTQAADELDILYLAEHLMTVPVEELVAEVSAPPEEGATEGDLAWFFKLFSLRGVVEGTERMLFFAYLQKTDDSGW
jgi:hypothetical protein